MARNAKVPETSLESRRWRFASFYNRVKRQVWGQWHPEAALRQVDPTGASFGRQDRLTVLRVRLKPEGGLIDAVLVQSSGIGVLDDVAIEAFKTAQPFPNPPPQMVTDGEIVFSFGFKYVFDPAPPHQTDGGLPDAGGAETIDGGPTPASR